jgi:beta-1,2-mannobiose phosphorylase / 1,2-beta-oligomannan phosphorylase
MLTLTRASENPILLPSSNNEWERRSAFNGSVVLHRNIFHLVYRAQSEITYYQKNSLSLSTIGYAESKDGVHFSNHKQLIKPEYVWELFGCEDPRITYFEGMYYIFYTILSNYPFSASGIKIGVALTKDLQTIDKKHPVTPFNAKAMTLFPERINGKIAALLTANTDLPPSKIAIAYFDKIEELWSETYWKNWYAFLDDHTLPLLRDINDQVEIGAVPIKTEKGWLLIYSYIKNYHSDQKQFGIEAVLLDLKDPSIIISRTNSPLLTPDTDYERFGEVPNIVFPSGAIIQGDILFVYYGAADTTCCLARCNINDLLDELTKDKKSVKKSQKKDRLIIKRFEENPILQLLPDNPWENKAVFNPAAVYEQNKVHIIYRAMSKNDQSVMGYAASTDGYHIDERFCDPVYIPREVFEKNIRAGNSGCEDPRITKIDNRFYMLYTAYDGEHPPRVAMTSIAVEDFNDKKWQWAIPQLISPPETDDKDACILPKKIKCKYVIFHRLQTSIWIDFVDDLHFYEGNYLGGSVLMQSRPEMWDSGRIGIASVPIETEKGWILFYHGITKDNVYKVSACLLDLHNPTIIIKRLDYPILEPVMHYEREGQVQNVVFPCGSVVIDGTIFIYYGGADSVVAVATIQQDHLLKALLK